MNNFKVNSENQSRADLIDKRWGAYDPVTADGKPQPQQVKDMATDHENAQWDADVRPDPLPGDEEILPEGLKRPRVGPDHKPVDGPPSIHDKLKAANSSWAPTNRSLRGRLR